MSAFVRPSATSSRTWSSGHGHSSRAALSNSRRSTPSRYAASTACGAVSTPPSLRKISWKMPPTVFSSMPSSRAICLCVSPLADGDVIVLTADRAKALAAATTYLVEEAQVVLELYRLEDLKDRWAYFEWQPEDAECPWLMHWAEPGDDMAIQIHYLEP